MSCVIIIWIFMQRLQFGVDIILINMHSFFCLSQSLIWIVIYWCSCIVLRKTEWKVFFSWLQYPGESSLCGFQTVSQAHSEGLPHRRYLLCVGWMNKWTISTWAWYWSLVLSIHFQRFLNFPLISGTESLKRVFPRLLHP